MMMMSPTMPRSYMSDGESTISSSSSTSLSPSRGGVGGEMMIRDLMTLLVEKGQVGDVVSELLTTPDAYHMVGR